ncbi:hypothetical protein CRENBAI_002951 [Crenichthys baileyi]|uniref:Uncharacterized protein n=1 Tax=Crenichthys baileyi TaxID=28760 RepID=A0AAV9SE14_9TELE
MSYRLSWELIAVLSPACSPSHALRLARDTSQYQTKNCHPSTATHFSSDDRITSTSSFPLASNKKESELEISPEETMSLIEAFSPRPEEEGIETVALHASISYLSCY